MDSLCRARNKIMYVLSWRTVSAPTRVLFWYLFPSLLRNSGNNHQNNPLVSAETIRHSSTYIILYVVKEAFVYRGGNPGVIGHMVVPRILTHWGWVKHLCIGQQVQKRTIIWLVVNWHIGWQMMIKFQSKQTDLHSRKWIWKTRHSVTRIYRSRCSNDLITMSIFT